MRRKRILIGGGVLCLGLAAWGGLSLWQARHTSPPVPSPSPIDIIDLKGASPTLQDQLSQKLQRRGGLRLKRRQLEPIIAVYEKLLAAEPNNLTFKKKLGLAYVAVERFEPARPLLEAVRKSEVADAATWLGMAQIEAAANETEKALRDARKALSFDPELTEAQQLLERLEGGLR